MATGRRQHRPFIGDPTDVLPPFSPFMTQKMTLQNQMKRRKGQKLVPVQSAAFALLLLFMLTRRKRRR